MNPFLRFPPPHHVGPCEICRRSTALAGADRSCGLVACGECLDLLIYVHAQLDRCNLGIRHPHECEIPDHLNH